MAYSRSIADLLSSGVIIRADEAVAVAQKLIHDESSSAPQPPFGPPGPDNVYIGDDGSVRCRACEVTPAVSEVAIFLQSTLPPGSPGVPGGLRYTIARALLDVDAPPFDSVEDLSNALARFETGDRSAAVRRLLERSSPGVSLERHTPLALARTAPAGKVASLPSVPGDRRRTMPSATDLRRDLREAEARLYEQQRSGQALISVPAPRGAARRGVSIATGLAAALALIVTGEAIHLARDHAQHAIAAPTGAALSPVAARPQVAPPEVVRVPTDTPRPAETRAAARNVPVARRTPPSSIRRARSARAVMATEDHIGPPQPATPVAALDVHRRPVFSPAFASNGSAMFFHSGRSDGASAQMSAIGRDDDLRVMTIVDDGSRNYHVQPSPDGRRIAFDSDRDGDRGVYVADRDGSHVRRVSTMRCVLTDPTAEEFAWSPDGRRVAFHNRRDGEWGIFVLAPRGGG